MMIDPKYTAVKGSRGPDIRCAAYDLGPQRNAQEHKKSKEPTDHLWERVSILDPYTPSIPMT